MAIQILGADGTSVLSADPLFGTIRATLRPVDLTSGGWFSFSVPTGLVTGVAANGSIFSARYSGTKLLMVRRVLLNWIETTAFTVAQAVSHELVAARNWTVADSGGTAINLTGNNQKHRTSFTTTSTLDARISTTAALTNGTRTLDTQALGGVVVWGGAIGQGLIPTPLFEQNTGDQPLILSQNEGLVINNIIAMGAVGVIRAYVTIEYAELSTY